MNHQNLLLLKRKGNVTVGEMEVINLPNVAIRTEWAINKSKSEELSLLQIGNTTTASTLTTDTYSNKNNYENTGTKGSLDG